ncbi:SMI1/KNR4 family protein [Pseudobacteroides cellulosolvens]|uniref:Cell wall assembly/cell proliferation coordinating protein, KNR4-like protein n=1 Tax=Pseudobacteroides cellulosolvens ATCC 35603 = DSM 2933 TaxID=398512 RepID=A0A0L6JSC4_9FIRM|nr:SMI1/KNR4 family protein [Pseudobacteroides cellulosolvens]KNY28312.1 Cell wall assembly/cell proliferation coordinating protein, KNR4-like protein [Pseudobacteroides cellulosolvens ATCC 35603 = DSM 2933]
MEIKENRIIEPLPSKELVDLNEEYLNVKFPSSFREFIMKYNGGVPKTNLFKYNNHVYVIDRFLCMLEKSSSHKYGEYDINAVCTMLDARLIYDEDLIGYELVPIAVLFAGNFLVLNFHENAEEPTICIWSSEESANLKPKVYEVSKSFEEFLTSLYSND